MGGGRGPVGEGEGESPSERERESVLVALHEVLRQVLEALSFCHQLTPRCVVHGDLGMDSIGLASISDPATSPHVPRLQWRSEI